MGIHSHSRREKVVSKVQHPYDHELGEFPYTHPALPPGVQDAKAAMDYVYNVLYPKIKPAVATPADLPTGIDTPNIGDVTPTINDQRIVFDDGDGKAAMYLWQKYDGDLGEQWHKIADIDWGQNSIISALQDQTQYLYVRKFGITDHDEVTGLPLVGINSGQHIYGGELENQHLSLHANNGDDPGVYTGYVQVDDDFRPMRDLDIDCGTATERWNQGFFGTLTVGTATMTITSNGTTGLITDTNGQISFDDENLVTTGNVDGSIITASNSFVVNNGGDTLTLTSGSILGSTGAISFGDENLSTTGTLASGVHTVSADLVLGAGSITSVSGAISFGNENLSTTGTFGAGAITGTQVNVDDIRLDGNTISIVTLNTDLALLANGTGDIDLQSPATTLGITATGTVDITGQLDVDDITINGSDISSSGGTITTTSHFRATVANTTDLGSSAIRWRNLFLQNSIQDGTNSFLVTDLMELRSASFRDVARSQPAETGDALFYDAVNDLWLASVPDSEIDHGTLLASSLLDDDHTQYALLAGRNGGQTLNGGTLTTQTLSLRNNATDGAGIDIGDNITPDTTEVVDLGTAALEFRDIHQSGQLFGSRLENTANPALLFNAADVGRVAFNTADEFIYVNDGSLFKKVGHNTYNATHTNVVIEAGPINVSASISDARNAIWQLCDISNGEEVMGVAIQKNATTVTIVSSVSLPAGNYRLLGIEL